MIIRPKCLRRDPVPSCGSAVSPYAPLFLLSILIFTRAVLPPLNLRKALEPLFSFWF